MCRRLVIATSATPRGGSWLELAEPPGQEADTDAVRTRPCAGPHGTRSARTHGGQDWIFTGLPGEVCQVSSHSSGWAETVCKTVGSAYVGSNPTPATTSENAPLAANSRASGAFLLCPVVCHLVALWTVILRRPRTHSGRASVPSGRSVCTVTTVGVHSCGGRCAPSAFPRTATDGRRQRRVSASRAPLKWVCGRIGDRVDDVPGLRPPCARAGWKHRA
jgi:hypothetical protein